MMLPYYRQYRLTITYLNNKSKTHKIEKPQNWGFSILYLSLPLFVSSQTTNAVVGVVTNKYKNSPVVCVLTNNTKKLSLHTLHITTRSSIHLNLIANINKQRHFNFRAGFNSRIL